MDEKGLRKYRFSCRSGIVMVAMILSLLSFVQISESAGQSDNEDELLAASLSDLRATMEKARQSNESYAKQNRLLHRQIDQIQEAIAYFEAQKTSAEKDVGESIVEADSTLTLADQEKALYEARVENFTLRQERFEKEGLRLQKKIKFYDDDNQRAQQNIAQLAKEIAQMESTLKDQPGIAAKNAKPQGDLTGDAAAYVARQSVLEKKAILERNYAAILAELSSGQEELARLQGEKNLIGRNVEAAGLDSNQAQNHFRQEVSDLQDYRKQFKSSLADLKKTVRMVDEKDNKNLEYILKNLKEQQVLLKQKLNILEGRSVEPVRSAKIHDDLEIFKKRLVKTQKELQAKINQEEKEYARSTQARAGDVGKKSIELQDKIKQSAARLHDLQGQMTVLRASSSGDSQPDELAIQVEGLEKNLQMLRSRPKDFSADENDAQVSQDDGILKKEIEHLVSRRDILAESVGAINNKYRSDHLSSRDSGATEEQLKEYWSTLSSANAALQEKLLVLQMRQDKAQIVSP